MASIQGILFPSTDNTLEELDLAATDQTIPDEPDLGDYVAETFSNSLKSGVTYTLGAMATGAMSYSPDYTQQQLEEIHPEVPPEMWKGGANAFQAEFLADKYKHEQYKKELYDFVSGVTDPQSGAARGLYVDTVGMLAELGGGLLDPITLGTFKGADLGAKALATPMIKIAPAFMKSISSSRLLTTVGFEVAQNVIGDVAVTYPLRKGVLDDYTKEDTTFKDTVAQAIGSAVAFSAVKYAYGSAVGKFFKRNAGAEFMDKMKDENFTKTKDKVNSHLNSDNANQATFDDAATHTATSPLGGDRSSVSERISARAFDNGNEAKFDATKAPYYGVYDKESGKADYSGDRFGDTHIFVSSPEAAQGLFDTYAKNGKEYSVYGHRGELNTIDLESTKAVDHPNILDIIEEEQGKRFLENLHEESSLADTFREVMNIAQEEGASGADTATMFDRINTVLAGDGYDGTTHFENQGNTRHTVMSVFDEAMHADDIQKLHEGTSDKPLEPRADDNVTIRTDEPFTDMNGKKVDITEPLPPDSFYDMDDDFTEKLAKYNDPNYLAEVKAGEGVHEKYDTMIEDSIKEVTDDIKESIRQTTVLGDMEVVPLSESSAFMKENKIKFSVHRDLVSANEISVALVQDNGSVLGNLVGEVVANPKTGEVVSSWVHKDFQRKGLATAAYNELGGLLKEEGVKLEPGSSQSEDAKAFWANRYAKELEAKAKAIQEEYKNNHPDQEPEVAKAIENCIRKNL